MIVNYTEKGWQIVTQRAHGLLAAQLCAQWRKDDQPKRWVDTLIATAEHDDVYNEFENTNLLNENGGPMDYKATSFNKAEVQQLLDMAETKSAYIALLLSRHIQFVHGEDPKAKAFIKTLIHQEKQWMKIADSDAAEVKLGYALLQFCDAFSLLLCKDMVQPEGRRIEISDGPGGTSYQLYAVDDVLVVEPWPYTVDSFVATYETRLLSQLTFENSAAFTKAIKVVIPQMRTIKLARGKT